MSTDKTTLDLKFETLNTGTILDRIVTQKKERIRARLEHRSVKELRAAAESAPLPPYDFEAALKKRPLTIIAEIKKASPSKGILCEDFNPIAQAKAYEDAGACAISVLTEQDFFLGCDTDLKDVVAAVNVPVLRKDFTIDVSQIYEARIMGASAILLIAAILPDNALKFFMSEAKQLGLSVIVEVHTMDELMRAIEVDAKIIGINNRDLHTFHVDLATTERLAPMIPAGRTVISESGIFTPADMSRCYRSSARSVLIGESLMRASQSTQDVKDKINELLSILPDNFPTEQKG